MSDRGLERSEMLVAQFLRPPQAGACQALLSTGFFRQEYWSGLPLLSPGDLSDPGIETGSPVLQADCLPSGPPGKLRGLEAGSKA